MAEGNDSSNAYLRGVSDFNREAFYEAHEALEEAWRAAPAADKKYFQGLTQLAVAFYHYRRGNLVGARSLMSRAGRNLEACLHRSADIDLTSLRRSLMAWQKALSDGSPVPPLPKL